MSGQVNTASTVALSCIFDFCCNDLRQPFNGVAGRRVVNVARNVALGLQVLFKLAHESAGPPDAVEKNNGVGHVKCRLSVKRKSGIPGKPDLLRGWREFVVGRQWTVPGTRTLWPNDHTQRCLGGRLAVTITLPRTPPLSAGQHSLEDPIATDEPVKKRRRKVHQHKSEEREGKIVMHAP